MPRRTRIRIRPRIGLRRWLIIGGLGLIVFLYYKPIKTYFESRSTLSERKAEVVKLRRETGALERRLARSMTLDELGRQARTLGYVKPGERLFIVKGIEAWRRAHRRHGVTIAGDG